jgi:hypothetical protein
MDKLMPLFLEYCELKIDPRIPICGALVNIARAGQLWILVMKTFKNPDTVNLMGFKVFTPQAVYLMLAIGFIDIFRGNQTVPFTQPACRPRLPLLSGLIQLRQSISGL